MAADADPNAAYLANRRSGESIQQTLARMEAVRAAQLEADARQAAENEKTWFNFWKRYRVDPDQSVAEMDVNQMNQFKAAQNIPYVPPQIQQHRPIPAFKGYLKRDILQLPIDPVREGQEREFLDQPILEVPGQWKGIRAFGEGAYGLVGLWEYTGLQENNSRIPKRVIVKELFPHDPTSNMKEEARIMGSLEKTSSAHTVRILSCVPEESDAEDDDDIGEVTRRIVMEYCPQGTLFDPFQRRMMK
jgi:hypothetical protein